MSSLYHLLDYLYETTSLKFEVFSTNIAKISWLHMQTQDNTKEKGEE